MVAVDVIFNEEEPHVVKESGGSLNMTFTLNATTSHDVDIMITITDITATGISNFDGALMVCFWNSWIRLWSHWNVITTNLFCFHP